MNKKSEKQKENIFNIRGEEPFPRKQKKVCIIDESWRCSKSDEILDGCYQMRRRYEVRFISSERK